MSVIRHFVSKKKRRFQQNGFDLDLTYITDNIVAMGYPSEKLEGFVRNKADDVIRFFDTFHPDSYKIYNLCSERKYDPSKFHNRVAEYPFEDHNAPRFEMLKPCCEDIHDWLSGSDDRNVVAIHCKAGKGRTGVIICSYLLHNGTFTDTKEALQFYGERRTQNAKGVTIPSQRRYVYYYSYLIRKKLTYTPTPLLLKSITLVGVPCFSNGICTPMFIVRQGQGAKIYQSEPHQEVKKTDKEIKIILPRPLPICGDLRIEFLHVSKLNKKEKMFQYWFNTFFIYHSCPTEAQELMNDNYTHSMPPTISEVSETVLPKHHKKTHQNPTHESDAITSLPMPNSPSTNSLSNEDKACSPELVSNPGIGLTKRVRKRESIRRSLVEVPAEAINPVYCDEFHLTLPKWELDRAHKDKDCKQYPDTFRVITSVANPLTPDQDEFDIDSVDQDRRHELVDKNSDLSEDDDDDDTDDDVREGTEVMGISLKKKDSSLSSGSSLTNSRSTPNSNKHEEKSKKQSKSGEHSKNSMERRAHSNAVTTPTSENGSLFPPNSPTSQPFEKVNFIPTTSQNNHNSDQPPKSNLLPTSGPTSPNHEPLSTNRTSPGVKRSSEISF